MSFLDAQLAGKFKGVSFLVRNETRNDVGQTRIKHKTKNEKKIGFSLDSFVPLIETDDDEVPF